MSRHGGIVGTAAARLALITAAIAIAGCVRPQPPEVEIGRPFALALDSVARTSDGLWIRYVAMLEDSRCPRGAQCVWAGTVRVVVVLTPPSGSGRIDTLDLTRSPSSAPIANHVVRFAEFSPPPPNVGEERAPASRTVATFVVDGATK